MYSYCFGKMHNSSNWIICHKYHFRLFIQKFLNIIIFSMIHFKHILQRMYEIFLTEYSRLDNGTLIFGWKLWENSTFLFRFIRLLWIGCEKFRNGHSKNRRYYPLQGVFGHSKNRCYYSPHFFIAHSTGFFFRALWCANSRTLS